MKQKLPGSGQVCPSQSLLATRYLVLYLISALAVLDAKSLQAQQVEAGTGAPPRF